MSADEARPRTGSRISAATICRLAALALILCLALTGCHSGGVSSVVVYTSQDEVYAEPILRQFTAETGIKALPVFDSEAVKTVGLVNRLLAERQNPQCDVFWNSEALRTWQLEAQNVFRTTNAWRSMGFRSRRLVINTNRLSIASAPRTFHELTNAIWRGKVAMPYPLFGTTATHFLVLRQKWGDEGWEKWSRALRANQPLIVDGNSVVVKLVGRGEAWIGMTDSDDVAAGIREGLPIHALPLTEESLLIPNTVAVIRNAPHPAEAQRLFDYLQTPAVLEKLVEAHALEGISPGQAPPTTLAPDYAALTRDLDAATRKLKEIFLR